MPNSPSPRKDPRGINFIDITDFTPGIYSFSTDLLLGGGNQPLPNSYPAPLGSATVANTWGCLPLPSGGLAPGPGFTETLGAADIGGFTGRTYTSSFYVKTNIINSAPEFIFTREGLQTSGPIWTQNLCTLYNGSLNIITNGTYTYSGITTAQIPSGQLTVSSRMGASSPGFYPVVVVPFAPPSGAALTDNSLQVLAYPDPTNNTTYALIQCLDINSAAGNPVSSLIAAYEGRVLIFSPEEIAVGVGVSQFIWDNEYVNFTDPVGNSVMGQQNTTFVPENPYGYTCVGTISAGELFVVKKTDAGGVITGDMNNPAITYLPGVIPGGGTPSSQRAFQTSFGPVGQGASSTQGYYYCASNAGAWRWNGGNTSTKISAQLDDNFFYDPSFGFYSLTFFAQKWGQYILFSNSWIYDELTGGWWRIRQQSPSIPTYFWYGIDNDNTAFYAAPTSTQYPSTNPTWTYPNTNLCDQYSRSVPASTYSWQSQPIPLLENQQVDIQEIDIKARAPSTSFSTCSISVYLTNELGQTTEFQTINNLTANDLPIIARSTGRFRAQQIQVTVVPNNTAGGAAPTIFSIAIGFKGREKVGVTI